MPKKIKVKKINKSRPKVVDPRKRKLSGKVLPKKKPSKKVVRKSAVKKKSRPKVVDPRSDRRSRSGKKISILKRSIKNPILSPSLYPWESEAVFNPGALYSGGRVHLFYRAMGPDGVSRIGYASSVDGINFDQRLFYPVYFVQNVEEIKKHWPYTSPARPVFDPALYQSGGGWGGCEDPRTVVIDGRVYMTFNMFNGWDSLRVAVASISVEDLKNKKWNWSELSYLSHFGDRQKNWMLFPEKINNKFAIFHNLDMGDKNPSHVGVAYVNHLDARETPFGAGAPDPQHLPDYVVAWHKRTRSAACPPIKTKDGWLLLYHGMDKDGSDKYKLGAMLLDLKDPSIVRYRAQHPILEPNEWYENDYKPGIIYACGGVVINGTLFVYYGGGDKRIGVATIKLTELVESIKSGGVVKLSRPKVVDPR